MNTLEVKNIGLEINGKTILKNINFNIVDGDFLFILGNSGSGKSTLLRICASLISQSEGEIAFNNKNYSEYNFKDLRKEVGYISQEPSLFGETVRNNFEFVYNVRKESVDYNRIETLLEKFNLDKDYLDKKIELLSGGEKQRIAIIRGILVTPKLLLLDEITSALDEENKLKVENIIKELNDHGVNIMWVTHDLLQINRVGKRWIKIESGMLVREAS